MNIQACKNYALYLRLPYLRHNLEALIHEAKTNDIDYEEFIELILERECNTRSCESIKRRIKQAKFSYPMRECDYKLDGFSHEVAREIKELFTLEFLKEQSNIILVGNPGVGKTALSIALGMKVCEQEKNVMFVNVSDLIISIKEAMSLHQINLYKRKFVSQDLVIIDDLGYSSFDKNAAEVLFHLLSSRMGKGSTIITTNLLFDRWHEIFNDEVLTGAIVDRISYKSHVVNMCGDSYRVKETINWLKRGENDEIADVLHSSGSIFN